MTTQLNGTEAQIQFANDLLSKLEGQSSRWINRRLASIAKRCKTAEQAAEKKIELWEEVRDLRIVKSIESAGIVIEYLKKLPLDVEILESPSRSTRVAMGLNNGIPTELTVAGWTQSDRLFGEMAASFELEDFAPDYAKS